ncbi:GH32 C-terminal domain-containing protein [Corynebacterium anserum]|uniref:beta-fructofuranosidase n=1 Tax=Corynebacterium anserum TaxID=2684406 RepID=A0A7G7YP96_9CORY|nr:GH32 C-terminal domain-containing protein [Corynebacterium anserum]MBC2681924.1 hydrolase [Corynebacterium anserum]QNH96316.1 hydrolase [Corynebacterium anserum]
MPTSFNSENQAQPHKQRPELHVTAELGVLEAPAGAVVVDGNLHVFHQFRPRAHEGSRWAHQVASEVPYDWDVCDDVLTPTDDELDVLAGSAVALSDDPNCPEESRNSVELFFVTSAAKNSEDKNSRALLGNRIPHGERGARSFTVQRALIPDLSELEDVSDDPSQADHRVERLGPISIDDSAYPVSDLVTPSVVWHRDSWLMIALSLEGDTEAQIVKLRSQDRQNWTVKGALKISDHSGMPSGRPFAPRLISLNDASTGEPRDVLFITYPGEDGESHEVVGYLVGHLQDDHFEVTTPFTVFDYGHDYTRPRLAQASEPLIFGLVGAHPDYEGQWANCLSSPRFLSLVDGHLYQDIVGTPRAVKGYSDRALIWTGQLDTTSGKVCVDALDSDGHRLVRVSHDATSVTLTRDDNDTVTAKLKESDSSTLTVFVDGPVCEVFADGGATSLTSAIPARVPVADVDVTVTGGAKIINSMVTVGQELLRSRAGLDSPEEQERFMAEALVADREVAEGLIDEE